MTTGDGLQSGGRASEAELLQRLAKRRTDYERAQAEAHRSGRFARIFSRRKQAAAPASESARWAPATPVKGLRRRPVAAYLTVTLVSATTVGAVALLAMASGGDAALSEPAAVAARAPKAESSTAVLASGASTPVKTATKPAARDTPMKAPETSQGQAGDPEVAAAAAKPAVTTEAADTGARLRPTTEDLPRSGAAAPAQTADAVAVALALRLPSASGETVAALPADLLTTGSIASPVGQRPNVDSAVDAGGAVGMARWAIPDAEPTGPVSTPTAGYGEAELASSETTKESAAVEDVAEAESKPTASVNVAVNMRAKPDNNAQVIAVLPKGRTVKVLGCKMWCEVSADGERGFVFKDFVNRKG